MGLSRTCAIVTFGLSALFAAQSGGAQPPQDDRPVFPKVLPEPVRTLRDNLYQSFTQSTEFPGDGCAATTIAVYIDLLARQEQEALTWKRGIGAGPEEVEQFRRDYERGAEKVLVAQSLTAFMACNNGVSARDVPFVYGQPYFKPE